jgi:GTP-binding protein
MRQVEKKAADKKVSKDPVFLGGVVKADDVLGLDVGNALRIAFAGRSNVGKSSLLNALTGIRVARVSATPGKTREMNFFRWRYAGKDWVLVDLPGYGYAKVPRDLRSDWGREITKWISTDPALGLVVSLVDGRHGYLAQDQELVKFLQANSIPYIVAFTKMDKWKSANQKRNAQRELEKFSKDLGVERYVFVSSVAKDGIRPLTAVFQELKS